jgi:hypothetical protein
MILSVARPQVGYPGDRAEVGTELNDGTCNTCGRSEHAATLTALAGWKYDLSDIEAPNRREDRAPTRLALVEGHDLK